MSRHSRQDLIDQVAARVDELLPTGDNTGGSTMIEAPMAKIEKELDHSALYVLRRGDLNIVLPAIEGDLKHFHGDNVEDVDTRIIIDAATKKTTIVCPDDFARFVSCRLSGWKQDLQVVLPQADPSYRQQESNPYTGGSKYKPKGYLVSFFSYISAENTKWTIAQTLTDAETLSALYNGQTPASTGASALSTGDIIALTNQADYSENGLYLVNASGAPTKISNHTSNTYINCGQAIEVYRADTSSDTLTKFNYIPKMVAEEIPDELVDAMIEHCAGRVFSQMGMTTQKDAALQQAEFILNNLKSGLIGES